MMMTRMMTVMMILMMTTVAVMARGAIRNIGNGGIDGGQHHLLLGHPLLLNQFSHQKLFLIIRELFCKNKINTNYAKQFSHFAGTQLDNYEWWSSGDIPV